jgi:hypothetical protein
MICQTAAVKNAPLHRRELAVVTLVVHNQDARRLSSHFLGLNHVRQRAT